MVEFIVGLRPMEDVSELDLYRVTRITSDTKAEAAERFGKLYECEVDWCRLNMPGCWTLNDVFTRLNKSGWQISRVVPSCYLYY